MLKDIVLVGTATRSAGASGTATCTKPRIGSCGTSGSRYSKWQLHRRLLQHKLSQFRSCITSTSCTCSRHKSPAEAHVQQTIDEVADPFVSALTTAKAT